VDYAVRMEKITKSFSGVEVLHEVDFELEKGEIHALIGANGAGKSTLIKILSGALSKDSGKIFVNDQEVHFRSPADAKNLGIQTVYQELSLVSNFSIAHNIYLGREKTAYGFVKDDYILKTSKNIVKELSLNVDVRKKIRDVSIGVKIMTEICRCLVGDAKIVILDEPSTVMSLEELKNFKAFIQQLRQKGISIIYISHRLSEIFQLCDRVTILRDGYKVDTLKVAETNHENLVKLMIGKSMKEHLVKKTTPAEQFSEETIRLENVSNAALHDISFSVKRGEVIGITGLLGAGKTELARVLFGADRIQKGKIFVHGKEVKLGHPNEAKRYNIGYVPEDRKLHGLLRNLSIRHNITISNLKILKKALIFVDQKKERSFVRNQIESFNVKAVSMEKPINSLSGGNQQKAILAKWLGGDPEILLLDEPTRGIDVGAKEEIYKLIKEISKKGISILIFSSEIEEILALSDRIIVLSNGSISGISSDYDEETILLKSTGGN